MLAIGVLLRSARNQKTNRILVVLAFAHLSLNCLPAQTSPKADVIDQAQKKVVTDAGSAGTPLPATINVSDNVNIEAVMLPRGVAKSVFGSRVADNYAVIEVNISNRSTDAALILQSLFIDLSGWALSGPLSGGGLISSGVGHPPDSKHYQTKASPHEISSVEYRIVRGQMLDAQPWTARNFGIRAAKVLGAIGTGFAFPFSKDVVAGIGAWNGAVVPGAEVLFPDQMEGQLNRVSDYGFRNNKIIPQQSADIVIAFFPIDRFLTPSLRKVFLDSPSLFFVPLLMVLDPSTKNKLMPLLKNAFETDEKVKAAFKQLLKLYAEMDRAKIEELQALITEETEAENHEKTEVVKARDATEKREAAIEKAKIADNRAAIQQEESELIDDRRVLHQHQNTLGEHLQARLAHQREYDVLIKPLKNDPLYNFLNSISLNNVHIVVSGVMTIDETTIPATIESTCFDDAGPEMWAIAGDKTCSITGRFLSNGVPKIPNADALGITDITVAKDASSEKLLKFTFKLKAPLDLPVEFDILVSKEGKNSKVIESMKYHVHSAYMLAGPTIASVALKDATATVAGTNFYSAPNNKFTVSVRPISAKGDTADVVVKETPAETATSFTLDTSKFDAKIAGCYLVVVKVGTRAAVSTDKLRVSATPKIESAKKTNSNKSLEISGTQLVSTKECGGSEPEFEILDKDGTVLSSIALSKATGTPTATNLTLDMPANASSVRLKGSTDAKTIQ